MKLRPPVKWHGGKYYSSKWIIDQFPPHRVYLEPFGGAASVLLNKEPCVEAYNDLDERITRLFRVLRDHGDDFMAKASLTPYSEVEFNIAKDYPPHASDVTKAWCDFVRWRQSRGGQGKSFSCTTKRARGGRAGDVNAWWTAIEGLPQIIERFRSVELLQMPAIHAIEKFDDPDALIYCDPPYLHSTRTSPSVYGVEMDEAEHRELASVLNACKSKVIISGYPSGLYDRLFKDWRTLTKEIANHASGSKIKGRETECLWLNF